MSGLVLHSPTILVLCALITVLIAVATLVGERQGIRHNGSVTMAAGMLLMGVGFFAFGMDRALPRMLVIVVGNTAVAASAHATLRAFQQLYGMPRSGLAWVSLGGLALMILLNLGFLASVGDTPLRSGLSGILSGVMFGLTGVLLWRRFEAWQGRLHRVIAASFFFGMVYFGASGGWELLYLTEDNYRRQANPVEAALAPALIAVLVLGSFGFLLMLRERDLLKQAMLDGLTGVLNRRAMVEAMGRALGFAHRSGMACAVVMLDLDHFKRINDTHGHAGGDRVIQHFAGLVGGLLRREDILGRYGGEEFAVLLQGSGAEEAVEFARRVREALAAQTVFLAGGEVRVTASAGIVEWRPGDGVDIARALANADQALYAAKLQGRDRAVVHGDNSGTVN